ncbi:hypothetical protein QBC45DRAFT_460720 [Copromyces sp. CBS 386.78]|nr:hypothetical protein QBC45DRAFT_460720 [Copromyces sp. CBS 386.78]
MSRRSSRQPPQAGGLGKGQDSKGPSNLSYYVSLPGWRKPQCPRCAYRAAMVGREQSKSRCDLCRTSDRDVEFYYPPGRGFEELSARVWDSLIEFAGHCVTFDAKPGLWETGLQKVEQVSRDFMACWNEVCRQHGKDLLQMNPQELKDVGCTSVITFPDTGKPVAAKSTSAVPRPDGARVSLESVLNEVRSMGNAFKQFVIEFRKHAENTKTEIELINDTIGYLEADFAKMQIQDGELAGMSDDQSEKLMNEIKELAQFVKAQSKTLSAVKAQVDRLAIKFSSVNSSAASNNTVETSEQSE